MTTFTYKDTEYTVVYIDPSAGSSGDGTSYSSPLTDFPGEISDSKCYLVRRTSTDYITQLPTGDHSSIQNIWIMGMPTEDDLLEWGLLDSGVKTAWGSDAATYANVLIQPDSYEYNNNSKCFYTSSLVELNANRCYFFRNSSGPSAVSYCNSMFRSTSSRPNYIFKHCKFGYFGNDIDDDTYLENNTSIDSDSSTYPQYKWSNYLFVSNMSRFIMDGCVVNYRENNHGNEAVGRKSVGFYSDGSISEFVIKDSEFNLMATSEYDRLDASQRSCFYNPGVDLSNTIQNVTVNYIYHSTDYLLPYFTYFGNTICMKLFLKNIEYNVKKFTDSAPAPRSDRNMYSYDIGMRLYGCKQYDIDNYVVNFNSYNLGIPYGRTLICDTFWRQAPGPLNKSVKNIKMTYCQERNNLICDSRLTEGSGTYAMYFGSDYGNTSNENGEQTTDWRTASSFDSPVLDGIDIDCPWGASIELHHATMVNANLRGRLQLDYGCGAEIESLYNNYGASYGVYMYGMYNYLRIKNYTVNKANSMSKYTGNQWQIAQRYGTDKIMMGNNIYVDQSNSPMFDLAAATTNRDQFRNCAFICPNMGATGQYYQRNQHCYVQSWNSKRTGSTALASYKFVDNNTYFGQYDPSYDLILGMEPYNGFQFTPTHTGKAYLTFYIAVHDEDGTVVDNDVLHRRFYVDVDTPHLVKEVLGGDDIYNNVKTYSLDCGALLDDNSTWANDNTVVSKKIVVPINIESTTKPVNIRIHYGWYDLTGYCYLDPAFTVDYENNS